ncbi:MAG: ROK family protein [Pseudomonadota bacterium]
MRVGVDLGGTKCEAVVLGPDGHVRSRRRVPTPRGDYGQILAAVAALVSDISREVVLPDGAPIGVGIPGSVSPTTGLVRNANTTELNGRPLDRDLAERLGRPVAVDNDANCFAVAEARQGAGRGHAMVFGVILGTGVGAGIAIEGQARVGRNAIAGEWGHMPLPKPEDWERPGPRCYCGRFGCIETWISGPGLAQDHASATGERLTAAEIAACSSHLAPAADSMARHLSRLARGLAQVVNVLDPDIIVLGGGLSNIPGLAERLESALVPHVFSDACQTPVRRHVLGDSAGVIGAAWLAP